MTKQVLFSTHPITRCIELELTIHIGAVAHYCDTLGLVRDMVETFFYGPVLGDSHWTFVRRIQAYGNIPELPAENIVLLAKERLVTMLTRGFPEGFATGTFDYTFTPAGDLLIIKHEPRPKSAEEMFYDELEQMREDAENGGYIPPRYRALIGG